MEPVKQVNVRLNPTNQSQIFTQHNYEKTAKVVDEGRYDEAKNRSRTPPATYLAAQQDRPATARAAGQQEKLSRHEDLHVPRAAGKNTMEGGQIINASRLDNVQHLIKADQPPMPIKDSHTTYNVSHMRQGFSHRQEKQVPREPQPKITEIYDRQPACKRHPGEVKSNFMLSLEEPLHDKSQTLVTHEIPAGIEPAVLKRELAKKGFHVVKSHFDHNTITNERTGKGFVQVRAANPRYHEELKQEIAEIGLKAQEGKGSPVHQRYGISLK